MPARIEISMKGIEANRTVEGLDENSDVVFNVKSSLAEEDRSSGFINLKFLIGIETEPSAARITASGTASVAGTDDEIEQLLAARERDGTPTLFMKVYQRLYPTMYLLCGSLHIPCPAPGLLRVNRIEDDSQIAAESGGRAEKLGIPR